MIVQLHSMTWPTSASHNDHPAAFNDLSIPTTILQLHSTTQPTSAYPQRSSSYFHDLTYASYPHRTSSCTHLRLNHTSYWHHPSSWRPNTTTTDFTYTFVILTINRHFCCSVILPLFPSLSLVDTTRTH